LGKARDVEKKLGEAFVGLSRDGDDDYLLGRVFDAVEALGVELVGIELANQRVDFFVELLLDEGGLFFD